MNQTRHYTVYGQCSRIPFWSWPFKNQFPVHYVRNGLITLAEMKGLPIPTNSVADFPRHPSPGCNQRPSKEPTMKLLKAQHGTPPQRKFTVRVLSYHCKLQIEFCTSLILRHGIHFWLKALLLLWSARFVTTLWFTVMISLLGRRCTRCFLAMGTRKDVYYLFIACLFCIIDII